MSLKKYVKDNIDGMSQSLICGDIVNNYKAFIEKTNPEYLDAIIENIDTKGLIKSIALCDSLIKIVDGSDIELMDHEIRSFQESLNFDLAADIKSFIKSIRLDEQEKEELMNNYIDSKSCDENFSNGNKAGIRVDYDTGSDRLMREHR
jgi:hypothetical protein